MRSTKWGDEIISRCRINKKKIPLGFKLQSLLPCCQSHANFPPLLKPQAASTAAAEFSAGFVTNYSMWSWSHNSAANPLLSNPSSQEYHMIKQRGVACLCEGVARQRSPMWFCCLCPLRNADKAQWRDPLSSQGSAHERRFIKTYVKWTCGWLRAWYPLLWSSLEGGMGGRQGGSSPQGLQTFGALVHSYCAQAEWSHCVRSSDVALFTWLHYYSMGPWFYSSSPLLEFKLIRVAAFHLSLKKWFLRRWWSPPKCPSTKQISRTSGFEA